MSPPIQAVSPAPILPGFNYQTVAPEHWEALQHHAASIQANQKKSAEAVIAIGQSLIEVKAVLPEGQFTAWVLRVAGMEERAAQQHMTVARRFSPEMISGLKIVPTALYKLSAPSVPDSAREEAVSRGKAGEKITVDVADEIIAGHRIKEADCRREPEQAVSAPPTAPDAAASLLAKLLPRPIGVLLDHRIVTPAHVEKLLAIGEFPFADRVIDLGYTSYLWSAERGDNEAAELFLACVRPEADPPTSFWFPITGNTLAQPVINAAKAMHDFLTKSGGKVVAWELHAFWWGCQAAIGAFDPDPLGLHLSRWRRSFETSLLIHCNRIRNRPESEKWDNLPEFRWRMLDGAWQDLRKARAADEAAAMLEEDPLYRQLVARVVLQKEFEVPSALFCRMIDDPDEFWKLHNEAYPDEPGPKSAAAAVA